ncbi:MAG: LysR family transcriptional regulator [Alphaproteobacteria bacterium]|nr:LysR family transcriptional regulator [Alphaproteobacteria bacterium]
MRETARLVFRSQPAVSLLIKDLEEIVGFRLIYHQRGSIRFTERGERFAAAAAAIERQLEASIDEFRMAEPVLKFGVTQDVYADCADELESFLAHGVRLVSMNSEEIIRFCRSGELDLGVAKTDEPLVDAASFWPHGLNWVGADMLRRKSGVLELALLEAGCFYHHLALTLFENARPGAVEFTICDDWDDIARHLEKGFVTIVCSDWTGQLPRWPGSHDLPPLPTATMNLIQANPGGSDSKWAADKVAARIRSAVTAKGRGVTYPWADRGIGVFEAAC